MIWIYVASAIFGGIFLIPMVLGGLDVGDTDIDGGDFDLDTDIDADLDLDLDVDTDLGADGDGPAVGDVGDAGGGALGAVTSSILSFRTVVFFSAFFGSAGTVLTVLDYNPVLSLIVAVLLGLFAGAANSVLFGLLRSSEANSQISDRTLEGRPAVVVLPIGSGRPGRVRIDLGGQPQYLVARTVDDGTGQQFDVGASVVVVEIEKGTAMVTSLAGLDMGEER